MTWNCLPWSTWILMSSMATQIHMAGMICTRVRRQLVTRSFSPWNSIKKAPTMRASGASQRRRWLSWSTACSTAASSLRRMASTRRAIERGRRVPRRGRAAHVDVASPLRSRPSVLHARHCGAAEQTRVRVRSLVGRTTAR